MSKKPEVPKISVLSFEPSVGELGEPVDPHAGKSPGEAMKPVVRAATGEPKVSIWDILGH
jgi:hypothetical protein